MNGTIDTTRGRAFIGKPVRFAGILLLLWSIVGALPAGPAYASKTAVALAALDPDCAPPPASGLIVYGCDDLSLNLQAARLWLNAHKNGQTDPLYENARRGTATYGIIRLDNGLYIIWGSRLRQHAEGGLVAQLRGQADLTVWEPANGGSVKPLPPLNPGDGKGRQWIHRGGAV
jgi:hypothetical protein